MVDLQQELLFEAKNRMQTPQGKESLSTGDIDVMANVITASIVGGAWAAMDEWGTGSRMDTTNPAFADYLASDAWNPARLGKTIVSRPDIPGQSNIFGNPAKGHGSGGVDLEKLGIVMAQPPSHAIETAFRWLENGKMQQAIRNVILTFPFERFFITSPR